MADAFKNFSAGLDAPARNAVALTLSDASDLADRPRFLVVGVAGNIVADFDNATSVTVAVPAGIVPLSPIRIRATGTTATGIVGCW